MKDGSGVPLMVAVFAAVFLSECHMTVGHDPEPDPSMGYHTGLRHKLLQDYDRYALPTAYGQILPIDVSFSLAGISYEVDDMKMTLRMQAWYRMGWKDKRLAWDPADHGNITVMRLRSSEVWLPDVTLYNEHQEEESKSTLHLEDEVLSLIYPVGSVLIVPVMTLIAHCDMDFTNWPMDEQICRMKFGSWTYDANHLNLFLTNGEETKTDFSDLMQKGNWKIEDLGWTRHSKTYPCCAEQYIDVEGTFKLTRARGKFDNTLINPIHAVVALTLASFFMDIAMKATVTFANAAVILALLMHHAAQVPSNVGDPSIFGFMGILLVLQVVNIVWTSMLASLTALLLRWNLTSNLIRGFRRGLFGSLCCCFLPTSIDESYKGNLSDEMNMGEDTAGLNFTDYVDPHHLAATAGTSVKNARLAALERAKDRTVILRILELTMLLVFACVLIVGYSSYWPASAGSVANSTAEPKTNVAS